jgi:hypothetical protein
MSYVMNRLPTLGLLTVAAALLVLPGVSSAGPREVAALQPGEYNGLWHGERVKFIFEKMRNDGTFQGVVRFSQDSNYPNATFVFTGKLQRNGSIEILRDGNPQDSRAGEPRREGDRLIWEGETRGGNLDPNERYQFELRVPLPR